MRKANLPFKTREPDHRFMSGVLARASSTDGSRFTQQPEIPPLKKRKLRFDLPVSRLGKVQLCWLIITRFWNHFSSLLSWAENGHITFKTANTVLRRTSVYTKVSISLLLFWFLKCSPHLSVGVCARSGPWTVCSLCLVILGLIIDEF